MSGKKQKPPVTCSKKTCIIFHSHSGTTRSLAQKISDACGGELLEIRPKEKYSDLSVVLKGCMRAHNGVCDPVEQDSIDISGYDLIVIGTPVWALKPTPVINGAIAAFEGCEGKKALVYATCDGSPGPGSTIEDLKQSLAEKGIDVIDSFVLTHKMIDEDLIVWDLINMIKSIGAAPEGL